MTHPEDATQAGNLYKEGSVDGWMDRSMESLIGLV